MRPNGAAGKQASSNNSSSTNHVDQEALIKTITERVMAALANK
jgi:hypothetical protein